MPELIPIRAGYRDKLRALALCSGLFDCGVVLALIFGLSSLPDHEPWRVAVLGSLFGVILIPIDIGIAMVFWELWRYRHGRVILDNGQLILAGRSHEWSIQLVDVYRVRWWWPKNKRDLRSPLRLWTNDAAMSLDLEMFTMRGREKIVEWLRENLPTSVEQVGVEEFAARCSRSAEDKRIKCLGRPSWCVRAVMGLAGIGAITGLAFGLVVRWALPELGPVEISPPHANLGPVVMRTPLDWAIFLGVPMGIMGTVSIGSASLLQWLYLYTERDVFVSPRASSGPP